MVADDVNVLEQEVRVQGGVYGGVRRFPGVGQTQWFYGAGYSLGFGFIRDRGVATGYLIELGRVGKESVSWYQFDDVAEAEAEHERLKAELFTREWVSWVATTLTQAGLVPAEFRGAVLAGELTALVGAADWQGEHDNPNAALLLRAAYHRICGEANVTISAGKGTVAVLNPQVVTKRSPVVPRGDGHVRAVVVEAGTSVRIVTTASSTATHPTTRELSQVWRVEERTFRLGDQAEYDSFNLVYFAPITAITAKTVVIADRGGTGVHRLTLAKFVEKNHDFDLAKAQKRNTKWTD